MTYPKLCPFLELSLGASPIVKYSKAKNGPKVVALDSPLELEYKDRGEITMDQI